jgi:hypothetical protein
MMECLSEKMLAKELWGTALEAIGTTEIDPACENFLRGWIAIGIQRMVRQDRISATDLTLAQVNLRRLVELMKIEASYLSTRGRLDTSTIKATKKRLRMRAALTAFELWPLWPHNFVVS